MNKKTEELCLAPGFLPSLAAKLSEKHWQKSCEIPVVWNGRLSRSIGRFLYRSQWKQRHPIKIEMSKHAIPFIDKNVFDAMLLHELCHYFLYIEGLPFHDRDARFKEELTRVGAMPTRSIHIPQKNYELYCQQCQQPLGLRKRINLQKYRSVCCSKPIIKKEVWI